MTGRGAGNSGRSHDPGDAEQVFVYADTTGATLFEVVRQPGKRFHQRRPDNNGGWINNLNGVTRIPYRLAELEAAAERGDPVFVVEGEKDADRLADLGLTATTSAGGAAWQWPAEWVHHFAGIPQVFVIADNDRPGLNAARQRATIIAAAVPDVRLVESMPDVDAKGDVSDWLDAGGTFAELLQIADAAPNWPPVLPFDEPAEPAHGTVKPGPTIDEFLNAEDPEYDWIVPRLIERGDRLILTGSEGGGKSTLLRQVAVQLGAGIHPFTLEPIDPIRVLLIDLENSRPHVRRKLRPLRLVVPKLDADNIVVKVAPQGLDLLHQDDVDRLDQVIEANRPDVLIIGPLYKMASGDPTEERVAKAVSGSIDRMRAKHRFALVVEAHTPHSVTAGGHRPERPYGASLWLRWPEFGLFLSPEGNLRHWRGARDERDWPAVLTRGGEWPWTARQDANSVTFARCLEEVHKAGSRLSIRDLAARIEGSKSQIQRAIDANKTQWDTTCAALEGNVDPTEPEPEQPEQRDLTDVGLFDDNPGLTAQEIEERHRKDLE